jgi:cephalosporin-C deacetylase
MTDFAHSYPFDPRYGHTLDTLREVPAPDEPADFAEFWQARYREALKLDPAPRIREIGEASAALRVYDIQYQSTQGFPIGGWLTVPRHGPIERGLVVGHGYGGRDGPDYHLPLTGAACLFPCFRGLSRSRQEGISDNPAYHVLHDIHDPKRYILGGCVEDLWLAATALLALFPQIETHLGYLGISFGGGIGAMALAWDQRYRRGHLNVPSFGNQALRLELPTAGSGAAVRGYQRRHGNVLATLQYYDAAIAARHIAMPMHIAAALFDPAVAPPGQFAIHNALPGPKELFVLEAGHFDYPQRVLQEQQLLTSLRGFFEPL